MGHKGQLRTYNGIIEKGIISVKGGQLSAGPEEALILLMDLGKVGLQLESQ